MAKEESLIPQTTESLRSQISLMCRSNLDDILAGEMDKGETFGDVGVVDTVFVEGPAE